jgi:hypothetical protein
MRPLTGLFFILNRENQLLGLIVQMVAFGINDTFADAEQRGSKKL